MFTSDLALKLDPIYGPISKRFLEKPDRTKAAALVRAGCLWNSGIFAWRASDLLAEVRAVAPELAVVDLVGGQGCANPT